jgi:hypothetical protein
MLLTLRTLRQHMTLDGSNFGFRPTDGKVMPNKAAGYAFFMVDRCLSAPITLSGTSSIHARSLCTNYFFDL